MLGRDRVDRIDRGEGIVDQHDLPAGAESVGDLGAARGIGQQFGEGVDGGVGNGGVPRDEHRCATRTVLGLGEEVGGGEARRHAAVGDDDDLRRPGVGIDADDARDLALGQRDEPVARPDDHVDRAERLGAEGEGGNGLRATDPVHVGDPDQGGGGQRRLRDPAVGIGRNAEHELAHPRELRGDRGHEHR